FSVTTTQDLDDPACGDPAATRVPSPLSLRAALCLADNHGGGSVLLPAGEFVLSAANHRDGSTTLISGEFGAAAVTIRGAGPSTRIVGDGHSPVLALDPDELGGVTTHVEALTVSGGGTGLTAGAGRAEQADRLVLAGVTVRDNGGGAGAGGGLRFSGGDLRITDSAFLDNTSPAPGGALAVAGTLSLERSRFAGNRADTGANSIALAGAAGDGAPPAEATITGVWFDRAPEETAPGESGAPAQPEVLASGIALSTARNWWGCGSAACVSLVSDRPVAAAPDLTLAVTAAPAVLNRAHPSAALHASLLRDQAGDAVPPESLTAFSGATVSWVASGLPGAAVAPTTATLREGSATTTLTGGPFVGTVQVTAALGSARAQLTVPKGEAPVVHGPTLIEVLPGESVSAQLSGQSDLVPIRMERVSGDAPRGLTVGLSANTVSLGGRIGPDESGRFPLTFRASNAAGSALVTVVIDVQNAPLMAPTGALNTAVGTPVSPAHEIRAAIAPGGTGLERIGVSEGDLPDGLSLLYHPGANVAVISGSARVGSGSRREVTIEAVNSAGYRSEQRLTVTVLERGRLELPPLVTGTVGVPLSADIRASHAYPALTQLAVAAEDLPPGLSIARVGEGHWRVTGTPVQPGSSATRVTAGGDGA
ncbi:hypothetical protein OOT08_00090, partial [Leucobacter sp. M11]|nr:hypothetical protein [Leucobacter sp. M11]